MEKQGVNMDNISKHNEILVNELKKVIEFHKSGLSDTLIDETKLSEGDKEVGSLINDFINYHQTDLQIILMGVKNLKNGDFSSKIKKLPGKNSEISDSLENLRLFMSLINNDLTRISNSFEKGDLNVNIDAIRYPPGFSEVVTHLNSGITAIKEPVFVLSQSISAFSEGKIPELNEGKKYEGVFREIIRNLDEIKRISKMRGEDIQSLIRAAEEGRMDARADATKYPGYNGLIVTGINKILDDYMRPINVSAEYIDRISKGDLPPKITDIYKGDFNEIKNNLNMLIDVVQMRNTDINMLIQGAMDGKLDARADSLKYPGENGRMIKGINDMLDAYIAPINVSAEYIDRISKGDLPPRIIEEYRGDFNEIKNNLNALIDVVHMRNEDIKKLIEAAIEGKLDLRADHTRYPGENGRMIKGINDMLDAYIGPINVSAEYIDRISKGDLPPRITEEYHGDFNEIKNNLNALIDVVHMRNEDIKKLIEAAIEGKLDLRADHTRYPGENGRMIKGINDMLDAYIAPINVSAEYIDRISKGDLPPRIIEEYRGDFNEIKNNLNALIDVVHMRNEDIKKLIEAAIEGKLDLRADHTRYPGENGRMIKGINDMLDAYIGPINVSAEYIDRISKGDLPPRITEEYHGDFNEIKNNLNALIDVVHMRNEDIKKLIDAGIEGKLDVRADHTRYPGENGRMIKGINDMLDAYIGPINVSAEYIDRISKGDLPPRITEEYHGDFNEIKNNLNALIDVVHMRNEDIKKLIEAAIEGKLDVRAVHTRYPGENGRMIKGINDMLDAYIGPINVSAEYIDRISKGDLPPRITEEYHGDFNEIKNNLNALIDVVHMRNEDIKKLIDAGIEGKLDIRADNTRYPGENGRMIKGINDMLDAYIGPINVSAEYIDRISKGDTPPKITDEYRGDFNEIKNNLNALIDVIHMRNDDVKLLTKAGSEGKLDIRADSGKYSGYHGKMIDNINKMLDNYIGPLNMAAEYIDRISKGDLPPKITDVYHGDFNELKNNLNQCIDAIWLLREDIMRLSDSALKGNLHERADIRRHQGDYAHLIGGVNATLDAVVEPIEEALRVAKDYANCDFTSSFSKGINVQGEFADFRDALDKIGVDISKTPCNTLDRD